ncbi:MAG TPA: DUF3800 domain-containing protein [Conexibacter sp.]|jgi:hypothetical protein|nr:DUF3800 domain-containing protein [Conexibacter sp.]
MSFPRVHADESGHSGQNLFDPDQPVFVLATVHLAEPAASRLASALADGAPEAHYTRMRRQRGGQTRILEALDDPVLEGSARTSALHKPYMVIAKFVDLLIEPVVAAHGGDLYRDDGHLKILDVLSHLGRKACPTSWDQTMTAFVEFIRRPSEATTEAFTNGLAAAVNEAGDHPVGSFLALVPLDVEVLLRLYARAPEEPSDFLDPHVAAVTEHILHWGEVLGPIELVYDSTKIMNRWSSRLLALSDPVVAARHDVTPTVPMPTLPLARLTPVTSHDSPAVQVADLLAGATADVLRALANEKPLDAWQQQLGERRVLRFLDLEHTVWPPSDPALQSEIKAQGLLSQRTTSTDQPDKALRFGA